MKSLILSATIMGLCALGLSGCDRERGGTTDAAITAEVERQLSAARLSGTIDAATENGTVTLTGSVPDADVKTRAQDIAQRVAGVSRVANNLRVVAAGDAPDRPAVNLPPHPPAESNVPPDPDVR